MQNSGNSTINLSKGSSNNSWNVDMILLDKDKEIINLSKSNRDLNKKINNLNKNINEKEMNILTLKTEISSLELDKKSNLNKIEKLNEKIKKLNIELEERNEQIQSISKVTDKKLNEINTAFNNHLQDYSNVLFQSQNLEREVSDLNVKLDDREKKINNYQKLILNLKNEIKQLSENNKDNLNGIKKNNNDNVITKSETLTFGPLISKENENIENNSLDNEKKIKENNYLNLIQFLKNQNEKMEKYINQNEKSDDTEKKQSNGFDLNNIESIKKKFENSLKKILDLKFCPEFLTLNEEINLEKHTKNKYELEINLLNKELNELKLNINELCKQYINNFNSFYTQNIADIYENITIPDFQIFKKPEDNLKNIINYQEYLFNILLKNPLSNLISPKKSENGEKNYNNDLFDISQSLNSNNNENVELKNKLIIISDLLQESNKCLAKSQEENNELLERNRALELRLNMLNTDYENKEFINNISLTNPNEKKKQMLIQELEIKDLQVKSLEKLLNQLTYGNKENFGPYKGKIISKDKYNKLMNVNILDKSFQKNEKYEKELNYFLKKLNRDFIIDSNGLKYFSKENSFNESIVTGSGNYIDESIQNIDFLGKIFKKST